MPSVREVLRLKYDLGRSHRQSAAALCIGLELSRYHGRVVPGVYGVRYGFSPSPSHNGGSPGGEIRDLAALQWVEGPKDVAFSPPCNDPPPAIGPARRTRGRTPEEGTRPRAIPNGPPLSIGLLTAARE